ncbi:porin family protein [Pedobacter arcticus]|uniref:hypothetical protein n=1 Tax=Pedobacter arcticus TaxID=752140 RepID=UPI00036D57EC|nr:hypothetical protein [Pedobacter arcticus]
MKTKHILSTVAFLMIGFGAQLANAQTEVANVRPYDQDGINVFEAPKESDKPFDKIKVKFGAGFTQSFQGLKHSNTSNPASPLYKMTPGFNTANANLFMDVQLADGILLNLTSYLSSRHHNETWVKGGYIQFDKLPFKGEVWDNIMKYATLKVGHMEINYGDQHFRRSDGGNTIYNPFAENYILDAFSTEIGGELLLRKDMFFGVIGASNGMIKGNIDELVPTPQDDNIHKSPSIYFKAGVDKQVNTDLRLRVAASYYMNNSSGGQTLYGGDRTGSNYFMAMEKAGAGVTYAANAFSGRLNPGFSKKVEAIQLNAFAKYQGLEFFGTYETASGRSKAETTERDVNQYAIDGVYRIGKAEKVFIGARYNVVKAELAGIANEVEVNRVAVGAGWFLTKSILLKGEYVNQQYKDFPNADYRAGGEFKGYVIQAVVGF